MICGVLAALDQAAEGQSVDLSVFRHVMLKPWFAMPAGHNPRDWSARVADVCAKAPRTRLTLTEHTYKDRGEFGMEIVRVELTDDIWRLHAALADAARQWAGPAATGRGDLQGFEPHSVVSWKTLERRNAGPVSRGEQLRALTSLWAVFADAEDGSAVLHRKAELRGVSSRAAGYVHL